MDHFKHFYDLALNTKVFDTHEHLQPHKNYLGEKPDILQDYFSHYTSTDLAAEGITEKDLWYVCDPEEDIEKRFGVLEPHLLHIKNTAYYRSLVIAMERLYGISDMTKENIAELNRMFVKNVGRPDYRTYIMKEICGIERSVDDFWTDDIPGNTTDLFIQMWQPKKYVMGPSVCPTLDEWCGECEAEFKRVMGQGAGGLKIALAYERSLYFEEVSPAKAEALYSEYIFKGGEGEFPKPLQDYMMHTVLKLANDNHIVVQIHTGLQEGIGHDLSNSNPMNLRNLFRKYPEVIFDIFHMGYPYQKELAVLAKTHPNVYIDMAWANIISPYAVRDALYEMLETVPWNKIFAFGGDYLFYDGVVGHVELARRNVAMVLAKKVDEGELTLGLAEKILAGLLHENAEKIFGGRSKI